MGKIDEGKVYTTGEVARVLGVAHASMVNWINQGKLKTFKLPGGANRIYGSELIRFMDELGMKPPDGAGGRSRILIVDDDPGARKGIEEILSDEKEFEVRTAANGIQAGLAAKEFRPDLIILDIKLGDMDGRELCSSFRADPDLKDVRIIGVSGRISKSDGKKLLAQGFDDYLPKPIRGSILIETIGKVLNEKRVEV